MSSHASRNPPWVRLRRNLGFNRELRYHPLAVESPIVKGPSTWRVLLRRITRGEPISARAVAKDGHASRHAVTIDSLVEERALTSVSLIRSMSKGSSPLCSGARQAFSTPSTALVFEYGRSYWHELGVSLAGVRKYLADHGDERLYSLTRLGVALGDNPSDGDLIALVTDA